MAGDQLFCQRQNPNQMDWTRKGDLRRIALGLCIVLLLAILVAASSGLQLMGSAERNMGHREFMRYATSHDAAHLETAVPHIRRAVAGSSHNPELVWMLSYALFRLGKEDEAADALNSIEGNADYARYSESYRRMSTLVFDYAKYGYWWGNYLLRQKPSEYQILQAIQASSAGRWEQALQLYRRALALEPGVWPKSRLIRYYRTLEHSEDQLDQQVARRILAVLNDVDQVSTEGIPLPADTIVVGPPRAFAGSWSRKGECWSLQSLAYDRVALERGPLVPMQLVWQQLPAKGDAGTSEEQRLTESILAVNLVPNGGFEWDGPLDSFPPTGWERSIYWERQQDRSVVSDWRDGQATLVGRLNPPPEPLHEASFVTLSIPVSPSKLYLLSVWMRSEAGNGLAGLAWRGARLSQRISYSYVAAGITDPAWKMYAGFQQAPAEARYAEVWLHIQNTRGVTFFDNLLFVQVNEPACP